MPENEGKMGQEFSWLITEQENSQNHNRNFARFVYMVIFSNIDYGLLDSEEDNSHLSLDSSPASAYINRFSERFGLNYQLLSRWCDASSIELATAYLPSARHERNRLRKRGFSDYAARMEKSIQSIACVKREGLGAVVLDHFRLGREISTARTVQRPELWSPPVRAFEDY